MNFSMTYGIVVALGRMRNQIECFSKSLKPGDVRPHERLVKAILGDATYPTGLILA